MMTTLVVAVVVLGLFCLRLRMAIRLQRQRVSDLLMDLELPLRFLSSSLEGYLANPENPLSRHMVLEQVRGLHIVLLIHQGKAKHGPDGTLQIDPECHPSPVATNATAAASLPGSRRKRA